jgi:hypothetical protein
MTIRRIIEVECENTDRIYLYREGLFMKAYNRSAFLFLRYGKNYEAFRKFFKSAGGEVAMLGFPSKILPDLFSDGECSLGTVGDDFAVVVCPEAINLREYEMWFSTLKLKTAKPRSKTPSTAPAESEPATDATPRHLFAQIVEQIEAFSIENSTPVECMMFVSRLKNQLKTKGIGYLREPACI